MTLSIGNRNKRTEIMKAKIFFTIFIGFILTLSYFYYKKSHSLSNTHLTEVKVALDWNPNTHYIGMYIAKHLGWYEESSLDVSFVLPQKTTTPYLVSSGQTLIGVSYLNNVIHSYNKNLKVKIISALVSKNTSCLSWTDLHGIKTLRDLEGKTYGGFGSPEELASLRYIFRESDLNINKVKIINLGVSDFLKAIPRVADFMWIFMAWDGMKAKLNNIEIGSYYPSQRFEVFDHPAPLLISHSKLSRENRKTVEKFLQVTKKAYNFVIENPNKSIELFHESLNELPLSLMRESVFYLRDKFKEKDKAWGEIDPKSISRYVDWMKAEKLISKKPSLSEIHYDDILSGDL